MFLLAELFDELVEKVTADRQTFSLDLVHKFPLIAWKHTGLVLEVHLRKQVISWVEVVTLRLKVELSIAHGESRELGRRSLEAYFLAVIENYMRPTHIDSVSWVQMNVDCRLKSRIDLVASSQKQVGTDGRMVADLLSVKRTPSDVGLIGLA